MLLLIHSKSRSECICTEAFAVGTYTLEEGRGLQNDQSLRYVSAMLKVGDTTCLGLVFMW